MIQSQYRKRALVSSLIHSLVGQSKEGTLSKFYTQLVFQFLYEETLRGDQLVLQAHHLAVRLVVKPRGPLGAGDQN